MKRIYAVALAGLFDLIEFAAIAGFVGMIGVWAIVLKG